MLHLYALSYAAMKNLEGCVLVSYMTLASGRVASL